jgi:hypothetical protein
MASRRMHIDLIASNAGGIVNGFPRQLYIDGLSTWAGKLGFPLRRA